MMQPESSPLPDNAGSEIRATDSEPAAVDDFTFAERIINYIRWPLLGILLVFNNFGFTENPSLVLPINVMLFFAILMTAFIQYRLYRGHSFGKPITFGLAMAQDALITAGVYLTGRYDSHFFIFYYPSLLGFSLAFSLRTSLIYTSIVGAVYAGLCWFLTPGFEGDQLAFKVLAERWLVLYMITIIGWFLVHEERNRRQRAVAAERQTARENEELYRTLDGRVEDLQRVGLQVDRAARQLATIAQGLTDLAEEMGIGCTGIEVSVEQLTGRAMTYLDQVTAIGQVSSKIVTAAHDLAKSAGPTGTASEQARRAVSVATASIQALSKRSQAIGDLAAAVRQVADQTNLLAFNANIEAIQAGQRGQRFAVVANEVRLVAEQAVRLAREIDELSHEIQQGTRQVLGAMAEIAQMLDQTVDLVKATSEVSRSQEDHAGIMAHSVSTLKDVAKQNAAEVQDVAATVRQQGFSLQRMAALSQQLTDSARELGALTEKLAD